MELDSSSTADAAHPQNPLLTMILIIDVSASMQGENIRAAAACLREIMQEAANMAKRNAVVKVSILTFADVCDWLYHTSIAPCDFVMPSFQTEGRADFGKMFTELDRRMNSKDLLSSPDITCPPVLILLSAGGPSGDYQAKIEQLRRNGWFRRADKYAIPMGDETLSFFTDNEENVMRPYDSAGIIRRLKRLPMKSITALDEEWYLMEHTESVDADSKVPVSGELSIGGRTVKAAAPEDNSEDDPW